LRGELVITEQVTAHLASDYASALAAHDPSGAYSLRPMADRLGDPFLLYLLRWQLAQPVGCATGAAAEPQPDGGFYVGGQVGKSAGQGGVCSGGGWHARLSGDDRGWWISQPSFP
jgi:hypothetical protein